MNENRWKSLVKRLNILENNGYKIESWYNHYSQFIQPRFKYPNIPKKIHFGTKSKRQLKCYQYPTERTLFSRDWNQVTCRFCLNLKVKKINKYRSKIYNDLFDASTSIEILKN